MDSNEQKAREPLASSGAYEGSVSSLTDTEPRRVRLEERGGLC